MNKKFVNPIANGGVPLSYDDIQRIENNQDIYLSSLYNLMISTTSETDAFKNGIIISGCEVTNIIGTQSSGTCDVSEGYVYFRCDVNGTLKNKFGYIAKFVGGNTVSYPFYMIPEADFIITASFRSGNVNNKLEEYRCTTSPTAVNGVGTYFKPFATRTLNILQKRAVAYVDEIKDIASTLYTNNYDTAFSYFTSNEGKGLREWTGWQIANGLNSSLNLIGKVSVGLDINNINFNTIGKEGGTSSETLTLNQIPSHRHKSVADAGIYGLIADGTGTAADIDNTFDQVNLAYAYRNSNFELTKRFTSFEGGGQSHNNLQPYATTLKVQFKGVTLKTD